MALSLKSIYKETKDKYGLSLFCGASGLSNLMNWVYIAEDVTASQFLSPGQLIITTGVSSPHSAIWLYNLIKMLIHAETSGLIINIGKYLSEEDISEETIALCEKYHFPLFFMPWSTHIADITHDYYHRIFTNLQTEHDITNEFLNLIHNANDPIYHTSILEEYGYPLNGSYTTMYYKLNTEPQRTQHIFTSILNEYAPDSHLCPTKQCFIIIFPNTGKEKVSLIAQQLNHMLTTHFKNDCAPIGIGTTVHNINDLGASVFHAKMASIYATHNKKTLCSFEDLGFYKILLSVKDQSLLQDYVSSQLHKVFDYDETHHSNYTETLHQYLLCDGSIQKIADAMFCHRNTINYRIHFLKEELGIALDDTTTRFSLTLAFYIREFLETGFFDI